MRHTRPSDMIVVVVGLLALAESAAAQKLLARPIELPDSIVEHEVFQEDPNNVKIEAFAINDSTHIVGEAVIPGDGNFAWILVVSATSPYPAIDVDTLSFLDGGNTRARDINNDGIVVGGKLTGGQLARVWDLSEDPIDITDISSTIEAYAVNNNDLVVGWHQGSGNVDPAFLWDFSTATLTVLDRSGSYNNSIARDLNDATPEPLIVGDSFFDFAKNCGVNPPIKGDGTSWIFDTDWESGSLARVRWRTPLR